MHKTYIAYYFPHSSCRSESSFHSFKEGPGIDKGHASLHSMLCNFELELLHDQVGLAQWMRCSEPLGSDAGLQHLTASPSCSLVESQHSLTGGRRFGSTALPLLFGVPTLGSDARFQGLRLTASPSCSLVGSQPSLARGRRFGSTALPLLVGATGSLLGGACYRQQLIVDWE